MSKIKNFFTEKILPFFKRVDWKNINTGTAVRYIIAIIATLNSILNVFGVNPINVNESVLYDSVSIILNVIILVVNTYKDNPTSKESIIANNVMKALKAASETKETDALKRIEDILSELTEEEES